MTDSADWQAEFRKNYWWTVILTTNATGQLMRRDFEGTGMSHKVLV
jgi:hypothetical protein